jgi:hypothetical protein
MIHLPFTSSVRGVSFQIENTSAVGVNSVIECRPEPDNPHDPNAIAVYSKGKPLGFLPAKLAATIIAKIGNTDFKLMGVVSEKYFTGEFHALKIKVSRFVDSANLDPSPLLEQKELLFQSEDSSKTRTKVMDRVEITAKPPIDTELTQVFSRRGRYLGSLVEIRSGEALVENSGLRALYPLTYISERRV